jgi:hypothetical protein
MVVVVYATQSKSWQDWYNKNQWWWKLCYIAVKHYHTRVIHGILLNWYNFFWWSGHFLTLWAPQVKTSNFFCKRQRSRSYYTERAVWFGIYTVCFFCRTYKMEIYISMRDSNTVVSAYTLYRHLQQYCSHSSIYKYWFSVDPIWIVEGNRVYHLVQKEFNENWLVMYAVMGGFIVHFRE